MTTYLDRLLPLSQASKRSGLSEVKLRALAQAGKIKAAILPDGEIGVSEAAVIAMIPTPKENLPEYQKHAHLKGTSIWLSEASRKYQIPQQTISRWVATGIIARMGLDGNRVLVDEADVAYCAEVYYKNGGQGRWLFNRDGTPYKPKTGPLQLPNSKGG